MSALFLKLFHFEVWRRNSVAINMMLFMYKKSYADHMELDAKAIKELPVGEDVLIPECRGLRLSISKTRRSWIYRYKSPVDGKMRQVLIGHFPHCNYQRAVAKWIELRDAREDGDDPSLSKKKARADARQSALDQVRQAKVDAFTVREMCDAYLEEHILSSRTSQGYDYVKNLFKGNLADLADVPVSQVTRAMAYEKIKHIADVKKAPVVAKNLMLELAAAMAHLQESETLPTELPNWWRLLRDAPKLSRKLVSKGKKIGGKHIGRTRRVLSEDELSKLIPWLPNFSQSVEDALVLYLWTGVRGSEIVQMEGSEVATELDGNLWWTCPKRKTKNRNHEFAYDLRVPLFGRARDVVLRRKARYGDGHLWPCSPRQKESKRIAIPYMEQESIGNRVREHHPRYVEKTGYPVLPVLDWTPHDLRRTTRTLLSALDCPRDVAEQVIGHVVGDRYDRHSYDPQRREWLKRLSDFLENLVRR